MNTHDIEPLQDAADLLRSYLKLCKSLPRGGSYHLGRIERAIAAFEADRQDSIVFKCGKAAGRQEVKDEQQCPDFWAWIRRAYREPESAAYTVYNMEVAYQAGRASVEADRKRRGEPVAAEIERLAANRYRPVPDGVFTYKVVAGDGCRSLFSGTKNECYVVALKLTEAFLDGAFLAENSAPQPAEPVKEVSDAPAALLFAAQVVELYDDATMDNDYMIDSGDCAGILSALADYFLRFNTTPPADGRAQQDAACVAPTSDKPASGAQNAIHATQPQQIPEGYKPNVPEPLKYGGRWKDHYVTGWNNCRAAMLEASPEDN